MKGGHAPSLLLAPSVRTEVVTTTTVTTTSYAPIQLPALPQPSAPKDVKQYPLLHARFPRSLSEFNVVFPDGAQAMFRDSNAPQEPDPNPPVYEDEIMSGKGWRMLRRDEIPKGEDVGIAAAIERFSRKRPHSADNTNDVQMTPHSPQPRKKTKPNADIHMRGPSGSRTSAAAPPSPLPSPTGSPAPLFFSGSQGPPPNEPSSPQGPFQPDLQLTTLLTLPSLLDHFSALPPNLQSHVLLTMLRHSPLPVLRNVNSILGPTLSRDFLTQLPAELVSIVLSYLPWATLARCTRVSKAWRAIIDSDPIIWRELLLTTGNWFGGGPERAFARTVINRREAEMASRRRDRGSLEPHPYKILFKSRQLTRDQWKYNQNPNRVSFPAHGSSVVTCLLFSHNRIISASDDHSIHVYNPTSGQLTKSLEGHGGGVWALAATKNILVSGSTDRTVRIWDLEKGTCTHVFGGHKSTVRCLAIVKPELLEIEDEEGNLHRERWPKRTLIVTGSRDHTLRVWKLPKQHEPSFFFTQEDEGDLNEFADQNPYHLRLLAGHGHAVRALAARGRTLVSGSYDHTVRVWDIITGVCRWVLQGHTQKVYSIVLDSARNQACSGSMDSSVRIWNLATGQCVHILTGHTSLVGLLGLSHKYLVSAAADSTLRVWDPSTGELCHTLAAHTGAITCFQHDDFKILSGSDGTLKMWDMKDGTNVRDLLTGITGVWQVVFDGRWCVAASNRHDATYLDVWDFGQGVVGDGDEEWIGEGSVDGEYGPSEDEDEVEETSDMSIAAIDHDLEGSDIMFDEDAIMPSQNGDIEQSVGEGDPDDEIEMADHIDDVKGKAVLAKPKITDDTTPVRAGPSKWGGNLNSGDLENDSSPLRYGSRAGVDSPQPSASGSTSSAKKRTVGSTSGSANLPPPPRNDESPSKPSRPRKK